MSSETRETILAAARTVAQAHGYTGLSFRELAKDVGIRSASIHYHFPTKGDLGAALARRYTEEAAAALDAFAARTADPLECLRFYARSFRLALERENRMCLCGFLAAEHDDLPPAVQAEVTVFADMNIRWLAAILARLDPAAEPGALTARALAIYAAIGGAQLVARSRADVAAYDAIVESYRVAGLIPG